MAVKLEYTYADPPVPVYPPNTLQTPYRKPYCCPPKAIPHNMNTSVMIVQKSTKMKRAQRLKRMSRR